MKNPYESTKHQRSDEVIMEELEEVYDDLVAQYNFAKETGEGQDEFRLRDILGTIRRCILYVEGLENVWNEEMSGYQRAVEMVKRGFNFESRFSGDGKEGIVITYLGYHIWDIESHELKALRILRDEMKSKRGLI